MVFRIFFARSGGDYAILFVIGAGAVAASLAIDPGHGR